jgi:hypothetical protein
MPNPRPSSEVGAATEISDQLAGQDGPVARADDARHPMRREPEQPTTRRHQAVQRRRDSMWRGVKRSTRTTRGPARGQARAPDRMPGLFGATTPWAREHRVHGRSWSEEGENGRHRTRRKILRPLAAVSYKTKPASCGSRAGVITTPLSTAGGPGCAMTNSGAVPITITRGVNAYSAR